MAQGARRAESTRGPVFGEQGRGRTVGLEPERRRQLTEYLTALPGGLDVLVFTNDHGGAIRETSWRRNFYNPAVAAALPVGRRPGFHDLRHPPGVTAGINPKRKRDV